MPPQTAQVSMYLNRPLRTLAAVCRAIGRDDDGRACARCPLRDMCDRGVGNAADPAHDGGAAAVSTPSLRH